MPSRVALKCPYIHKYNMTERVNPYLKQQRKKKKTE